MKASPHLESIGRIVPPIDWKTGWQRHSRHEMTLVISGRMDVTVGREEMEAIAGDILFYHSGVLHREVNNPSAPVVLHGMAFQHPDLPGDLPPRTPDLRGRVRTLAAWLDEDRTLGAGQDTPGERAVFETLLLEWQRLILYPVDSLVERTRHYIQRRLTDALSLDDLARNVGLSKHHFVRTYRKLTGTTPVQDLIRLRLDLVRHLLITTSLPLKVIAERAGIGDQYQLCRLFKARHGVTPGRLRARGSEKRIAVRKR